MFYYAAALIGCITGLACTFVCLATRLSVRLFHLLACTASEILALYKLVLTYLLIKSEIKITQKPRDDGKRPDELSTASWKEGRCFVWDFTCPDTLAASHLDRAASGPGAVATEAEARKRSKYSSLAATYHFVPVAVETLGALGDEAA